MGTWGHAEFRTVALGSARVAVFGHRLADERWIARDFAMVLRHWRYEWLTRWPGSYAAVISDWDGITILTDLAGQYPVFTSVDERGVAYCSLARPLLPGGPRATTPARSIRACAVLSACSARSWTSRLSACRFRSPPSDVSWPPSCGSAICPTACRSRGRPPVASLRVSP